MVTQSYVYVGMLFINSQDFPCLLELPPSLLTEIIYLSTGYRLLDAGLASPSAGGCG